MRKDEYTLLPAANPLKLHSVAQDVLCWFSYWH